MFIDGDKNRIMGFSYLNYFVALILTLIISTSVCEIVNNFATAHCHNHQNSKGKHYLMFVSTLDGKISALNVHNEGQLVWSIEAGHSPLLSSSISHLEINRNGRPMRLIPSLDGGLYQFDGSTIEAVPFTADTLLSSSFKLNENSIIVGGKETETYGIDAETGQLKYLCDVSGCKQFGSHEEELVIDKEDDILVITRNTKTVRAVTMATGNEKWNFSVGQHELSYLSEQNNQEETATLTAEQVSEGDVDLAEDFGRDGNKKGCVDSEGSCPDSRFDFPWWYDENSPTSSDVQFKVIVPKGTVLGISKKDPNKIIWQYEFKIAIANVWILKDGHLKPMDLFDSKHIPALAFQSDGADAEEDLKLTENAAVYIGVHKQQLYIQPSIHMLTMVEESLENALFHDNVYPIDMPRIRWLPYLATANSRTPAETNTQLISWKPGHETWDPASLESKARDLTIWNEYPYDIGYYVYQESVPLDRLLEGSKNVSKARVQEEEKSLTLWTWWKEILTIAIVVTVVNFFTVRVYYKRRMLKQQVSVSTDHPSSTGSPQISTIFVNSQSFGLLQDVPQDAKGDNYVSRYSSDFIHIKCLGRGGFGVVFQAKNKMDDLDYAVKRITLNNSDKAKEKVMREVKALAKLDHFGIVRYYQAWLECPPVGWQEEFDKALLCELSSCSVTPGNLAGDSLSSPTWNKRIDTTQEKSRSVHNSRRTKRKVRQSSDVNPLQPFKNAILWDPYSANNRTVSSNYDICDNSDSRLTDEKSSSKQDSKVVFIAEQPLEESGSWAGNVEDVLAKDLTYDSDDWSKQTDQNEPSVRFSLDDTTERNDDSLEIIFEDSCDNENITACDDANIIDVVPLVDVDRCKKSGNCCALYAHRSLSVPHSYPHAADVVEPARPASAVVLKSHNVSGESKEHSHPRHKLYLYIQMQMCKEESLKDWLGANTLNRAKDHLLVIFEQLVSAINYVHKSGLMHRDLKPSNIFFSHDGTIKIGDFGLVAALEEQGDVDVMEPEISEKQNSQYKVHTDQVGTKLYMSPEQVEGKHYTQKVDIYALGLILFELFYPFATQMERYKTLMDVRRYNFPDRFERELPHEYNLVRRLLSKDPDDRPNAGDILEDSLMMPYITVCLPRSSSRPRTISQDSNSSVTLNSKSESRSCSESTE